MLRFFSRTENVRLWFAAFSMLAMSSCGGGGGNGSGNNNTPSPPPAGISSSVTGVAQKGPFAENSRVSAFRLSPSGDRGTEQVDAFVGPIRARLQIGL